MQVSRLPTAVPTAALAALGLAALPAPGAHAAPARATILRHPSGVVTSSHRLPYQNTSACGKRIVYAASYDNTVYVYDQKHNGKTPCGSITGFNNPQGLFVDKHQHLWAVNQGTKQIFEFARGNPTPIKTLEDPSGYPVDVAVDNVSRTVYVSNFFQNGSQPGVIEVYAHGSRMPTATLSDPYMTYAFYDAVDNQGNLYVTFLHVTGPSGVGQVFEWIGGTGTPVNLGITLVAPGGIQTTNTGALLICDQGAPACGDFPPGSTTMTNLFATKDVDPFAVTLDKEERHAFVEDVGDGQLQRWAYPGPDAHPQERIAVPGGAYAGVAASPAAPQGLPY